MTMNEEFEALQVAPGTLAERLQTLVGMPVTVYLMAVHAKIQWADHERPAPDPWPPYGPNPGSSGGTGQWGGGMPGMHGMGTAVVSGTLVGVGPDYLELSVPVGNHHHGRRLLIPFTGIGALAVAA